MTHDFSFQDLIYDENFLLLQARATCTQTSNNLGKATGFNVEVLSVNSLKKKDDAQLQIIIIQRYYPEIGIL